MRICHIITTLDFGGAERLLLYIAQEQSQKHDFHIIYLKNKNDMQPMFPTSVTIHHASLGWSCASTIRTIVKNIKPDVVHTHLGHADWIGLWAVRGLKVKRFCTMHNIWYKWNWTDYIIFFIYKLYFNVLSRDCTVICISKSVEEHVKARLAVPDSRRVLLYNAVPSLLPQQINSRATARTLLNLDANTFYVLFVGRFEKQKAVHTLIDAAAILKNKYPQIHFLLVGEGSLRTAIEEQVKQLQVETSTTFIGKHEQPEIFMQAANVLVLPSIFEGLGMVILEAFRASIPVVSTNIEGPKELIEDKKNGFLVTPEQPQQLADKISFLFENIELRDRMGATASLVFQKKYNIKSYVQELEKLYESA